MAMGTEMFMLRRRSRCFATILSFIPLCLLVSCKHRESNESATRAAGGVEVRHVVLLGTNDMHGGIAPSFADDPKGTGGLQIWDAIVRATKAGAGDDTAVVLVDAGDQFQGSLMSNHSEGAAMFAALNIIGRKDGVDSRGGYDAVIPGNHDYDFGPKDWLRDSDPAEEADYEKELVTRKAIANGEAVALTIPPTTPARQRALRGAMLDAMADVKFPVLSANTYEMSSLIDAAGQPVLVDPTECKPVKGGPIDWAKATRPSNFAPYRIVTFGDLRVAIIGIDHVETATTTVDVNVRDLCFRKALDAYLEVLNQVRSQADVYIMATHNSDLNAVGDVSKLVSGILNRDEGGIHAVIAGHTHRVDLKEVAGVPIIQSGSGGGMFGRIDLYLDATKRVIRSRTNSVAGVKMHTSRCATNASEFCRVVDGKAQYEGQPLVMADDLKVLLDNAQQNMLADLRIKPEQQIGKATEEITRDFNKDSPMGRAVTDLMRKVGAADVALINSGSIRANFPKTTTGQVTYDHLFNMLPFATRMMVAEDVPAKVLVDTYKVAVTGTKAYGVLLQSGLKVTVGKTAAGEPFLYRLETGNGELIYDSTLETSISTRTFKVVTTDFLMRDKSGADFIKGQPKKEVGVLRELLADHLVAQCQSSDGCYRFKKDDDGRWGTQSL